MSRVKSTKDTIQPKYQPDPESLVDSIAFGPVSKVEAWDKKLQTMKDHTPETCGKARDLYKGVASGIKGERRWKSPSRRMDAAKALMLSDKLQWIPEKCNPKAGKKRKSRTKRHAVKSHKMKRKRKQQSKRKHKQPSKSKSKYKSKHTRKMNRKTNNRRKTRLRNQRGGFKIYRYGAFTPSGFNRVISKPEALLHEAGENLHFEYKSRDIASGGRDYSGIIGEVIRKDNGDYILRKRPKIDTKENSFYVTKEQFEKGVLDRSISDRAGVLVRQMSGSSGAAEPAPGGATATATAPEAAAATAPEAAAAGAVAPAHTTPYEYMYAITEQINEDFTRLCDDYKTLKSDLNSRLGQFTSVEGQAESAMVDVSKSRYTKMRARGFGEGKNNKDESNRTIINRWKRENPKFLGLAPSVDECDNVDAMKMVVEQGKDGTFTDLCMEEIERINKHRFLSPYFGENVKILHEFGAESGRMPDALTFEDVGLFEDMEFRVVCFGILRKLGLGSPPQKVEDLINRFKTNKVVITEGADNDKLRIKVLASFPDMKKLSGYYGKDSRRQGVELEVAGIVNSEEFNATVTKLSLLNHLNIIDDGEYELLNNNMSELIAKIDEEK